MILVTGATGNVGSALVDQLAASRTGVRALTRDASRARFPDAVEVAEGDLTHPESLDPALKGVDALFLLLPGAGDVSSIMDAARRAGVERVVLVSTRVAQTHPDTVMGRGSLSSERAVRDSGLSWTVLRPGEFASNALWWAASIREEGIVRGLPDEAGSPTIHPADVAAVARVALTEDGHHARIHPLTGPETITGSQQVQAIGRVVGRDLCYEEITTEQARQGMERNVPVEIADSLLRIWSNATTDDITPVPTVEEVTGVPARTFEQWVHENADVFR